MAELTEEQMQERMKKYADERKVKAERYNDMRNLPPPKDTSAGMTALFMVLIDIAESLNKLVERER